MAKTFLNPFVLALLDGDHDDIYDGGASAHGTLDDPSQIFPVDFSTWQSWFVNEEDYDPDFYDVGAYYDWWVENGFSEALWYEKNPNLPFPPA